MTQLNRRRHTLEDVRFLHTILALTETQNEEKNMVLDEVQCLIQTLQGIDPC